MTPGRGYAGSTSVQIQPYEENIYNKEITGYVQLEDIYDKGVRTLIRWKQTVSPDIQVSGTVSDFPAGSTLYFDVNGVTKGSKNLSDGAYSFYIARNTPYRLYVKYQDHILYDESFEGASANITKNIIVEDFIIYTTTLPVNEDYIEVD